MRHTGVTPFFRDYYPRALNSPQVFLFELPERPAERLGDWE